MTPEERVLYQAVITEMQNTPESSYPNIATNASIPLYFWINMGGPSFAPTALELQQLVADVNTRFNFANGARFTFCGVSYLNDSRWYVMNSDTTFRNVNVFNTYYKQNSINIYIPQSFPVNFAGGPGGDRIVLLPNESDRTLAHELGHVFGLIHTLRQYWLA